MSSRWLENPWLRRFVAAVPFLALVLPHLGFVPLWDGAVYGECLEKATAHGFDLWALNCSEHPSMLYMLPLAVAWKAGAGAMWPVLVVNALLGVAAIAAFLDVVDRLLPQVSAHERLLLAATFGLVPPVAASVLNLNVDFGTLVFFLLLLSALLREAWWWAAAAGVALAFTKEPGIALAGLATIAFLVAQVWLRPGTIGEKVRASLRAAPMLVAPLAFAGYLATRSLRHERLFWDGNGNTSLVSALFSFHPTDPVFRSFLASVFAVNFMWIPAALVLLGGGAWVVARVRGKAFAGGPAAVFVALLFIGSTYVLTRYRTYTNVRYFLPLFPLALACAHLALVALFRAARARQVVLAGLAILFAVSSFRTVDPLARRLFGTFRWGEHEVLRMVSITNECCGHSRDQLVYNLEFLRFDDLLGDVLQAEQPRAERPLVIPELANWFVLEAVTPTSPPRRAPIHAGNPHPAYFTVRQLSGTGARPPEIVWLDLANADGRGERAQLERWYEPDPPRTFSRDGYTITATTMHRRPAPAADAVH